MAKVQSTISLLFLFVTILAVANCEKQRDENYGLPQGNADQFPGRTEVLMEPNFLKKIGSHIVKGWHGFKGLFGRKSNRGEENIYGGYGREEKQKPYDNKETNINKEYPESNYNNNYGNGEYNQNQFQGQKGNQENNQGFQGAVDERNKGQKEDKVYEFEESSNKPFDGRKDEKKVKSNDKKSPQAENNFNNNGNNFQTELGNQNDSTNKQRSRRDLLGRFPIGRPFRQPFRRPFRQPFRPPFRLPGRQPFRRPF